MRKGLNYFANLKYLEIRLSNIIVYNKLVF